MLKPERGESLLKSSILNAKPQFFITNFVFFLMTQSELISIEDSEE